MPSWNYVAVHAYGEISLIETPEAKDALLKRLIGVHEPTYAQQWRDLGEEYQHKMLMGIVGFELKVTRLEAKFKLNQHRKEAHLAMRATYAQGTQAEQALAGWMERLGNERLMQGSSPNPRRKRARGIRTCAWRWSRPARRRPWARCRWARCW